MVTNSFHHKLYRNKFDNMLIMAITGHHWKRL